MPIEAELTAVLREPGRVRAALAQRAVAEHSVYADVYYDRPDHSMDRDGYELRIRTITTGDQDRSFLTYKEPPADESSRSKPEHETGIAEPVTVATILTALGLVELITLEKHCDNYRFHSGNWDMLATVVTIPELGGQTFIEVETMADQNTLPAALDAIRTELETLGVTDTDAVTDSYTNLVAQARS